MTGNSINWMAFRFHDRTNIPKSGKKACFEYIQNDIVRDLFTYISTVNQSYKQKSSLLSKNISKKQCYYRLMLF